ncbi:hypothetical protein K438DRAFT_129487 [Mycena galopus ATCC 62051]|nr:hypothetical protein K438DRAFT_129487 [Mycena galopus ATCC 62051]
MEVCYRHDQSAQICCVCGARICFQMLHLVGRITCRFVSSVSSTSGALAVCEGWLLCAAVNGSPEGNLRLHIYANRSGLKYCS